MRVVLQRVSRARVTVDDTVTGEIGPGHVLLVGFRDEDGPEQLDWMADKILGLRVFPDDDGKMNLGLLDIGGDLLVVSQFTLYGDTRKGRRPGYSDAARPEVAEPLVERVIERLREAGATVATGRFRAEMAVELVNDGPITLSIET